jgi:5-formyltetrahydrofolate cyclo-ligase
MDKKQMRQQVISKRNALTTVEHTVASSLILEHLKNIPEFKFARAVAGFVAFRNEVATKEILEMILSKKIALFLPRINPSTRTMQFYHITDLRQLIKNNMGILEPDPEKCVLGDIHHISLVLTPGVVFSKDGYRIGYGGGYYDRFFTTISEDVARVGLAFDLQIVDIDEMPRQPHDLPVHRIITESQIMECTHFHK